MKHHKPVIIFLTTILIFSFFLRFYKLGSIPNGLSTDEADMGYNAYSIIKTGKDVYGRPFPLFFQALDDYKPGLVFYSLIPVITIFGLNEYSIRILPAILGALIPVQLYFLVSLIYPKNKKLGYLVAILTTFAPWSIEMSRAMIWYVEMLFFYLLFLTMFIYAIRRNFKLILLSGVFLSFTLYIYYAALIYLIPIVIILTFIYRSEIFKNLKIFLVFLLILLLFSSPALIHYRSQVAKTRLNAISVLTPDITLPTSISEMTYDQENKIPFRSIIHNRRFVYFSDLIANYFRYFNLDYLFINSKNVRYFYVNNVGLLNLIELPMFLYGLYLMTKRREKSDILILSLLAIAPFPAMITLGTSLVHRAVLLLPAIQIISTLGLTTLLQNIFKNRKKFINIIFAIFFLVYLTSFYFFLHQYFVHSPKEFTSEKDNGAWYSTVRDAIPKVNVYKKQYEKAIFSWSQAKLVPPVYFLFHNQVNPQILQAKAAKWTNEAPSYHQIYDKVENIEFRPINWEQDKKLKHTLFIGYPSDFQQDADIIDRTFLPNGEVHFLFVKTD